MTPTKESLFAALSFTLEAVKYLDEKWWPYAAGLKLSEMFTDYQDVMDKESAKTKAETLKLIKAIARERTGTDLDAAFDFASS